MRPFRKLKIPARAHPLVRQMTEIQNTVRCGIADLADRSGVSKTAIHNWRHSNVPRVSDLQACLNALGYELVIRRIGE